MRNSDTISFTTDPTHECPTCGNKTSETGDALRVSIQPYDGLYCLHCYAKWVSETFPRLRRIQAETGAK